MGAPQQGEGQSLGNVRAQGGHSWWNVLEGSAELRHRKLGKAFWGEGTASSEPPGANGRPVWPGLRGGLGLSLWGTRRMLSMAAEELGAVTATQGRGTGLGQGIIEEME